MKNKSFLAIVLILIVVITCLNIFRPFEPSKVEQMQQQEDKISHQNITADITNNPIALLSDEDFTVKNDDTFIELGNTLKNLKLDDQHVYVQYANEKHAYDVYTFENFAILTQPFDEGIVFSVYLTKPILKTYRGIGIGDTVSDVIKEYGLIDKNPSGCYEYHYNGKTLTFYVDESDKVTGIHFQLI